MRSIGARAERSRRIILHMKFRIILPDFQDLLVAYNPDEMELVAVTSHVITIRELYAVLQL